LPPEPAVLRHAHWRQRDALRPSAAPWPTTAVARGCSRPSRAGGLG